MAKINCGVDDCEYCEYGECIAEEVDIDMELTAAGFLNICQTFTEKED